MISDGQATAEASSRHSVAGLKEPASIRRDRYGVAHIRAGNRRDAFFCQGFQVAADRLWQIDLWRKRGLGLLAADFGPGYLAQDAAARLFLYRGDMAAEWSAYGVEDARETAQAFTSGINACIDLVRRGLMPLPEEFSLFGSQPSDWQAEDVVRIRTHGLIGNAVSEWTRARMMALSPSGARLDQLRQKVDPPCPIETEPAFARLPSNALNKLLLATAPVTFSPERLAARLADAEAWGDAAELSGARAHPEGSNNWAVSAARTATGRPILASDPHRSIAAPSLRYVSHLKCPGMNVIGAGEPAIPGISIGHNDDVAFGLTIFPADQQDIVVHDLERVAIRTVSESIAVKGHGDQDVTLEYIGETPVVWRADGTAISVRSVWAEPGSAPYFASLAYLQSRTVEEFGQALQVWSSPSVNQVAADIHGNIAHHVAASLPVRDTDPGLLPVLANDASTWAGFRNSRSLPRSINPACGYVYSANELNPDFAPEIAALRLGFEFTEPFRARRIAAALAADRPHSIESAIALQLDTFSSPARRVLDMLPRLSGAADEMLAQWDCRSDGASAPALLFEVWWRDHLKPGLIRELVSDAIPDGREADLASSLIRPGDAETLLRILEDLPAERRNALFRATFSQAFAHCLELAGPEPALWRWGDIHQVTFPHAARNMPALKAARFAIGTIPASGSESSVLYTEYAASDFEMIGGASFRVVMDVGAWDNCRFLNAPGQSGDPRSPHYRDHACLLMSEAYVPLLFSDAAIDDATESIMHLRPAI